jgi:hypothetical protein
MSEYVCGSCYKLVDVSRGFNHEDGCPRIERTVFIIVETVAGPTGAVHTYARETEFRHIRKGDRFVFNEESYVNPLAPDAKVYTATGDAYPFPKVVLDNGITYDSPSNFAVDVD